MVSGVKYSGKLYCLGENSVGWGKVDDEQSIKSIHRALDLGITRSERKDKIIRVEYR
jgi:hypothetical protein